MTVADCGGRQTTYDKAPERVFALSDQVAELLVALGLGDRIVGVTRFIPDDKTWPKYRAEITKVPVVGGPTDYPSQEQVVASSPDLVISIFQSGFSDRSKLPSRDGWKQFGANAFLTAGDCDEAGGTTALTNFDFLYSDLRAFGKIFGVSDRAEQVIADMQSRVAAATAKVAGKRQLSMWNYAGEESPLIAGAPSVPHAIMTLAGVRNVFGDVKEAYAEVSFERPHDPRAGRDPDRCDHCRPRWAAVHLAGATRQLQGTQGGDVRVSLDGVEVAIDGTVIVHGASITIPDGAFVGVVGPNGSGKTTLMRTIYRSLRPATGTVSIGDQDPWAVNPRRAAQLTAVVAQESTVGFEFTVAEVAAMGRIPHKGSFDRETATDRHIVAEALAEVGMAELAHRRYSMLSGGERQRVLIARALVQGSPVLVLDEPTNHLDIRYQLDVLHQVRRLGLTTLAALHDLNLAAAWCDHVYVMNRGRLVAGGPPEEALDPTLISDVFGVTAVSFRHPITGRHQLLFDRSDPTPHGTGVTTGDRAQRS